MTISLPVDGDQRIVGPLVRARNVSGCRQIEGDLMTGGALNMKRDATPDTGSRTVDVAKKHEIRHPRALKDLPFRFGVLELEGVHVRQAEVERRMMLEQKDRAILWGPPQAVFKEGKTLVTKLAGMGRRGFRRACRSLSGSPHRVCAPIERIHCRRHRHWGRRRERMPCGHDFPSTGSRAHEPG